MNKTLYSSNGSERHTNASASKWREYIEFAKLHSLDSLDVAQSGHRVPVQEHIGSVGLGSHTVDIDDLLAELVSSPEDEQEMKLARRQVGTFLEHERLGGGLRALRLKEGLSQQRLAELAGMTQPKVARLEQGIGDPQASTLARIATALNCKAEQVYVAWTESKGTQDE